MDKQKEKDDKSNGPVGLPSLDMEALKHESRVLQLEVSSLIQKRELILDMLAENHNGICSGKQRMSEVMLEIKEAEIAPGK